MLRSVPDDDFCQWRGLVCAIVFLHPATKRRRIVPKTTLCVGSRLLACAFKAMQAVVLPGLRQLRLPASYIKVTVAHRTRLLTLLYLNIKGTGLTFVLGPGGRDCQRARLLASRCTPCHTITAAPTSRQPHTTMKAMRPAAIKPPVRAATNSASINVLSLRSTQ